MGAGLCRRPHVLHGAPAAPAPVSLHTMSYNRSDWIIIGICGVTCGGKTTLADRLKAALTPVYIFHQDKYFFPDDSPRHTRCEGLDHNNYDVVTALDMDAMLRDVTLTMRGHDKSHARSLAPPASDKFSLTGKKFLVLEGFTVLNFPPIMELCDMRYYFTLEYGECVSRRVLRLYEPPDIDGYFDLCVWPQHLAYRAQIEKDKRVKLIDGAKANAFEIVMEDLRALGT